MNRRMQMPRRKNVFGMLERDEDNAIRYSSLILANINILQLLALSPISRQIKLAPAYWLFLAIRVFEWDSSETVFPKYP